MSPRRRWLSQAFARSERVVTRKIGSELVLVPLAERGVDIDSVFNLQGVAPFIWDQLDGRRSGDAIVDAVVERYAVSRPQAAADYVELVETLREMGAAVLAATGRARRVAARARAAAPPHLPGRRRSGSGRSARRLSRRRAYAPRRRR